MHWYDGSIAEAVTLSKQRNAIFVVFVEGDNELSAEMVATLDDANVLKRLSNPDNFLAIKLKSGSVNYTHFAQIYQFVPVPSVFFIGRNGTPLEVVCAGVDASSLAARIDKILEEHRKETPSLQPSTSSQNVKEQSESLIKSESTLQTKNVKDSDTKETPKPETSASVSAAQSKKEDSPVKEYDIVCDGDVCTRKPRNKSEDPGPSYLTDKPSVQAPPEVESSDLEEEEKLDRAKQLIEARRKEKLEKEKEEERKKELERRELGQNVSGMRRWQAEQELKQIQEDRKREKHENNLARQRILEQIAQDRAERRAREAASSPTPPLTVTPVSTQPSGDVSSTARIQFKMPDGASHTAQFSADDNLASIRRYVADNLQLSSSQFSLWTAFPRRELIDGDATLRNLGLAPSAALLVLERRTRRPVPAAVDNRGFFAMLMQVLTQFVVQPAQSVWDWLRNRLFGGGGAPVGSRRPRSASPQPTQPPAAPGLRHRPPSNVHRLTGDRSQDDDNNTWNGNSTQQM